MNQPQVSVTLTCASSELAKLTDIVAKFAQVKVESLSSRNTPPRSFLERVGTSELIMDQPWIGRLNECAKLTPQEWNIFRELYRKYQTANPLATYEWLGEQIYGLAPDAPSDEFNTIKVQIHHMRRKLHPLAVYIPNVWGKGFRLDLHGGQQ